MKEQLSTQLIPLDGGSISLETGQCWQHGGTAFRIVEIQCGRTVLESIETTERKTVEEGALLEEILCGRAQPMDPRESLVRRVVSTGVIDPATFATLSDSAARRFVSQVTWLRELRRKGIEHITDRPEVRFVLQQIYGQQDKAHLERFALSTLITASRTLRAHGGDPICLLPRFSRRGGKGRSRLHPLIEETITQVFNTAWKSTELFTKQRVIDQTLVRCREACELALPTIVEAASESTVARRFDERFSKFDIAVRRFGKRHARLMFRENGPRPRACYPLEIAEYDDTDTRVYLLDRRTGLPCGRAYLTAGVDQNTRVPLGISLGFSSRSHRSAIDCVLDGLLPKDKTLAAYRHMDDDWVGYGAPAVCLMDNAVYNHADATLHALLNLETVIGWAKPRQPTEKSAIEHFNDRVKADFCPSLPGWSGDGTDPDGHHRGAEQAVMYEDEFRALFVQWVVGDYCNKPMAGGLSPRQEWRRFFGQTSPAVRWPREQIQMMRMMPTSTTFRASGGLLVRGLRYGSDALVELRRHLGSSARVDILTHPDTLSFVLVKHPHTGALIRAECLEDERYLDGMTVRLHQLVLKHAWRQGNRNPSWKQVIDARHALAESTTRLAQDRRLRRRSRAARDGVPPLDDEVRSTPSEAPTRETKEVLVCDLEQSIYDLESVELDQEGWA